MLKSSNVHVGNNSGENEWYTPSAIIEAARLAMGNIDLDPASSTIANATVKAAQFFSMRDDGLTQPWTGNVWLNPPYSQPEIGLFSKKVLEEWPTRAKQVIVLVNNATETEWFQNMLNICSAVCFPKTRIKFLDVNGKPSGAPLQGQAILYFGKNVDAFADAFITFGLAFQAL